MKRAAFLALLLLAISTSVLAATATHPVLVATKPHVGRLAIKSMATGFDPDDPTRDYREFTIVNGFAANLTDDEIAALWKSPNVLYVEPDFERHALGTGLAPVGEAATPLPQVMPYGISLVRAPQAWVAGRGATINVVVIDSGIDYHHPELSGIFAGGQNFVDRTKINDPMDDNGHGTHCAGIIAAADNAIGVVGVAPQVRLWAVKALAASGSGRTADVIAGLNFVADKKKELGGNWVVSLSLGSCHPSDLEGSAFDKVIQAGIIVVAAAGNHDPSQPDSCPNDPSSTSNSYSVTFPAAYPGVIAVAALDSTKTVADFSNFGPEVLLSAPGVDVLSTFPVGTGNLSLVTPSGGAAILAPPLQGSPAKDVSSPYVFCGLGNPADFPASVNGKIALIKRGTLTFHDKAKNAKAAGAVGVVIFNKDTSPISWRLVGYVDSTGQPNPAVCDDQTSPTFNPSSCHVDPVDAAFDWPVTVGIPQADGQALVDNAKASLTINYRVNDDYAIESGTSMACPHVAGVAATVWSIAPGASADVIKQALTNTAHDLGDPGVDNHYGYGLVDAEAAAKQLNPGAFNPQPSAPTGRKPGRRGH